MSTEYPPPPVPPPAGPPPSPLPVGVGVALKTKRHWSAVVTLVLGIAALVLSLIPFVGIISTVVLAPATAVFAVVSLLKTGNGRAGGRVMALVGLALGIVSVGVTAIWILVINKAVNDSLDSVYGSGDTITTGPGRTEATALTFGATTTDEHGVTTTASAPATAETTAESANLGFNFSFTTTLTFSNTGDKETYYQPWGRANTVGGAGRQCQVVSGNLAAVNTPLATLKPGETQAVTGTFACESADPLGVITVMVETGPEPYASKSYFTGPLDGGQTR